MIIALLCISLLPYSFAMLRAGGDEAAASETESVQHAAGVLLAEPLEDDPVWWPTIRNGWTALDERQLIRPLKGAAS